MALGDTRTTHAVPWDRLRAVPVDAHAVDRKVAAAQCYRTQVEVAGAGTEPLLPPFVLQRLLAVREVVF